MDERKEFQDSLMFRHKHLNYLATEEKTSMSKSGFISVQKQRAIRAQMKVLQHSYQVEDEKDLILNATKE